MANLRVRDLLDQVNDFHQHLRSYYTNLSAVAKKERVKMLLEHVARHEEQLAEGLAAYEQDAAAHVLDTWFEFTPDLARCERLEDVSLTPDMSIDEAVRTVLLFNQCLGEYYKQLAELSPLPEIGELFENLMESEEGASRAAASAAFEDW
jgi:rubrerythrin